MGLVKIKAVTFKKESDSKFGKMYHFEVSYLAGNDERKGYYSSTSKDHPKMKAGDEIEVTEETKTGDHGDYIIIKPFYARRQSNFGKALDKEKARYSGFAVSYVKDLVISGKVEMKDFEAYAWKMHKLMVEMDKSLEQ